MKKVTKTTPRIGFAPSAVMKDVYIDMAVPYGNHMAALEALAAMLGIDFEAV